MSEDREVEGQTPSPGDDDVGDLPDDATADDQKADEESKDSFPASDPPSW